MELPSRVQLELVATTHHLSVAHGVARRRTELPVPGAVTTPKAATPEVGLTDYFYGLAAARRGNSARGRSLHVLYFLDFVWARPQLPLHTYRPSRRPVAFTAMVFDLLGDASRGYTEALLEGAGEAVRDDLRRRLETPWRVFLEELGDLRLPHLALVLDETVRAALRQPGQSSFPSYLARLELYMTPAQLALLDLQALMGRLSVGEVLTYLHLLPLTSQRPSEEQHPVGGDLRKAIRQGYDALWCAGLASLDSLDLITFFACFPVDILELAALVSPRKRGEVEEDFCVFYANVTDAKVPGRLWQPPEAYVGGLEDLQHFAFLTARTPHDSLMKRARGLMRLGLSGTFPETIRWFDARLEQPEHFPELHARQPWRAAVEAQEDAIAQARLHFLEGLARRLREGGPR